MYLIALRSVSLRYILIIYPSDEFVMESLKVYAAVTLRGLAAFCNVTEVGSNVLVMTTSSKVKSIIPKSMSNV